MEKLHEEIREDLAKLKPADFIPPQRNLPAVPGIKPLGELSEDLKRLYTLKRIYCAKVEQILAKMNDSQRKVKNPPEAPADEEFNLWNELNAKMNTVNIAYLLRLAQKYGRAETISPYSDWHVYNVPAYYK
ncbi:MAG: hypothetical protein PHO56_04335 [Patescibacteria group bacterium]|nr:hypothetical protein [Patescibacteria group bacterium]